jgi:hypothetical protein
MCSTEADEHTDMLWSCVPALTGIIPTSRKVSTAASQHHSRYQLTPVPALRHEARYDDEICDTK